MDIPTACVLWGITRDDGGDFERIIQYGAIRYHLLLRWNIAEEDCVENAALRKVYANRTNIIRTEQGPCSKVIKPKSRTEAFGCPVRQFLNRVEQGGQRLEFVRKAY